MTTPYSILGLSVGADATEARKAFRAIAKSCHPDINPDPKARETFQAAERAYRQITGSAASADKFGGDVSRYLRMAEIDLPVSIFTVAQGGVVKGTCPLGKASVKVPKGARSGDRILTKINNKDVACVIRIIEEDGFRADGGDISSILRISASQAKTGSFADIETPTGKFRVKIPENTPDGARLRVEGRGLPQTKNRAAGHLYLDVEILETMTDKAVSALDKILERAKRPRNKMGFSLPVFGKKSA